MTADGSTIVTVQGRLREHSKFWLSNLEASEFVKQIVQFGYRIPFLALPAPVDPCIFQAIDASWGPHSVDCFASSYNALLPRFHGRFWSPGCEAVDTFTVNWGNELNWWVPPLHFICRTICHASQCRAKCWHYLLILQYFIDLITVGSVLQSL